MPLLFNLHWYAMSRDRNAGYTQQPSPLISFKNIQNFRTKHALLGHLAPALGNNAKNSLTDKDCGCERAALPHRSGDVCGSDVLMHGDMVFENIVFKKLLNSKEQNAVLINNKEKPPEKDFKGRIEEGVIKEIGVNVFGEGCFFLAPVYKFSKETFLLWLEEMEKFIKIGEINVYAENAFNVISSKIRLKPIYFSDELCMELDNMEDMEIAIKLINKNQK